MPETAPQLIWEAAGSPAPAGKTGSRYRLESALGRCATCAAPIVEGVPARPRRGVAGIDNDTFTGHAEYLRFGTHVCSACAWLYGDPKRAHRGVLALGRTVWWPTIAADLPDRPRWRRALGDVARAALDTPMTGVLTTDPKPRLWPRARLATAGQPGLYVHAPDYDRSTWMPLDLHGVAAALAAVDAARGLGAVKAAIWTGLGVTSLCDRWGVKAVEAVERRLAALRPSAELLVAILVA